MPDPTTATTAPPEGGDLQPDGRWPALWQQVEPQRAEYLERDGISDVVIEAMSDAGFGIDDSTLQAGMEVGYLLALREVDNARQLVNLAGEYPDPTEDVALQAALAVCARLPIEGPQGEPAGWVLLPDEIPEVLGENPDAWHLCPVTIDTRLVGLTLAPIPVSPIPEVRAATSELVRAAQGHAMQFRAHEGSTVIVRLATGPEMLEQHREACERVGTAATLTLDQATQLVLPLPEANR